MASIEALLGVLRASDYGARGGGNRDDAPGLIQALAIAAVAGGAAPLGEGQNLTGGIVTLDPGVLYRIGRTVNIPSNVELVIPTGAIVRAAPGFAGAMFAATGAAGLRVTGGGIVDGNRAGGAVADPFVFTNCADGNLDGPIVQGGNTDGVTLTGCTRFQVEIQSQGNGRHGVYHSGSTFCGGTILARDNGQRVAGSGVAFDVASTDNSYQLVATDTRAGGAKTQQYGMFEVPASGCDRNVISASSLTGNALGTLSLVGGASGYIAGAPAAATVGDAQIAAGGLSNAALGSSVARLNMLVNGGFEIWQRGASFVVGQDGFFADRWQVHVNGLGTITSEAKDTTNQDGGSGACAALVAGGAVTLGVPGGAAFPANGAWIKQKYEDFAQLKGKTVTFSIRVKGPAATTVMPYVHDGTALYNGQVFNSGAAYTTVTMTQLIAPGAAQVEVGLMFGAVGTFYVDNATLVVGAVPMDYQPLTPADDLARCLRYYQRYTANISYGVFVAHTSSATNGFIYVPLQARMGGTPSLTLSALTDWAITAANYSGAQTLTALVLSTVVNHVAILTATVAAGLTPGGIGSMGAFPNGNGWLVLEWNP